jgi:hypothetical protein
MNINIDKVKIAYKEKTGNKLPPLVHLANELDISQPTITNYLNKNKGLPKVVDFLKKLSEKTGLTINEIIE